MHIKEYRIALPMSVEEYRIAQLYMIQKKSREESRGAGSGVEICVNEPYTNGPGGNGQYTFKIYHIGNHLPAWFRAILPKSALRVEEEAWNAYPYTKTRYRCPFIEKFSLEIETRYLNDGGDKENLFDKSQSEVRNTTVDYLDIVKDHISSYDYSKEEDPTLYKSSKTQRGPLTENWWSDSCERLKRGDKTVSIMTAYKLCRVEFKYWGMQSKIERWIHDIGLRKTMLRAHRQAWCWQDEYYGLKLSDIRQLELETQKVLAETMAGATNNSSLEAGDSVTPVNSSATVQNEMHPSLSHDSLRADNHQKLLSGDLAQRVLNSRSPSLGSKNSFESATKNLGDFHANSLEQLQESSSEEEFFDAHGDADSDEQKSPIHADLMRASSLDLGDASDDDMSVSHSDFTTVDTNSRLNLVSTTNLPPSSPNTSKTTLLILVFHAGSILDGAEQPSKSADFMTLKSTFDTVMKAHYSDACQHIAFRLVPCPSICSSRVKILESLSPYSFETQHDGSSGHIQMTQEFIPIGTIALLSTTGQDYIDSVSSVINQANSIYTDFLQSDEGRDFNGQVCVLADGMASLTVYDALTSSNLSSSRLPSAGSQSSITDCDYDEVTNSTQSTQRTDDPHRHWSQSDADYSLDDKNTTAGSTVFEISRQRSCSEVIPPKMNDIKPREKYSDVQLHVQCPSRKHSSSSQNGGGGGVCKFNFEVSELFTFGSPLALVLAFRQTAGYFSGLKSNLPPRPKCHQMYNLFHARDPCAVRLESLINDRFRHIPPVQVPRYSKFPLGDGEPIHVVEIIQSNSHLFSESHLHSSSCALQRQGSINSISSQVSGLGDLIISSITNVTQNWWGNKRLDYSLYCPEALMSFPANALPHLFQGSYWESTDVVAFIVRQIARLERLMGDSPLIQKAGLKAFKPSNPREKWMRRRTTIKVKNLTSNHRGNDVIVLEDKDQTLLAKFMYGPLDMIALTGERIDVHVMINSQGGEWVNVGTSITDTHGRVTFTIPKHKRLNQGIFPVKLTVRGDHTSADFFLAVLPPNTQTVIFSIDGSFTASVSIMGKDPKVRAGAVDVVRHWQDLGYLILYVTARPDMQQKKVTAWLAQHNFPHGMVIFMDGLSKDPLKQKLNYLKNLQTEAKLDYQGGYGSSKDISIYRDLQLEPHQIFCIGKASKKQQSHCQMLMSGYAAHLTDLAVSGSSRPAVGNARLIIRKSCFRMPSQSESKKRTNSMPRKVGGGVSKSEHQHPTTDYSMKSGVIEESQPHTSTPSSQHSHGFFFPLKFGH